MFRHRVKFLVDWRECMRDETKTFKRNIAHELVEQGIAIYVNPKKKQEKKFKKKKEFRDAPKNTMLAGAPITK